MNDIRIICCDVDGTLVNDLKQISCRTADAIRRAVREKDIIFAIVSGRMLYGIRGFYSLLGIEGPVSAYNGCALYDEHDNLIADHRLDRKIADIVIEVAHAEGMDLVFYDNLEWYMERTDCYTYSKKYPLYCSSCRIADLSVLSSEKLTNKLLTMDCDKNRLLRFEKAVRARGVDESVVFFYRGEDFLEIMPASYTKGTAVEDLRKYFGVDRQNILAIGDDFNDIPMLKAAGHPVAMANAAEEVKKYAEFVTESNNEDGVAIAIERYCL